MIARKCFCFAVFISFLQMVNFIPFIAMIRLCNRYFSMDLISELNGFERVQLCATVFIHLPYSHFHFISLLHLQLLGLIKTNNETDKEMPSKSRRFFLMQFPGHHKKQMHFLSCRLWDFFSRNLFSQLFYSFE